MAEKSAQNLLDEIAASKKNSLARLIYAGDSLRRGTHRAVVGGTLRLDGESRFGFGGGTDRSDRGRAEGRVQHRGILLRSCEPRGHQETAQGGREPHGRKARAKEQQTCGENVCVYGSAGTSFARGGRRVGETARRLGGFFREQEDGLRGSRR